MQMNLAVDKATIRPAHDDAASEMELQRFREATLSLFRAAAQSMTARHGGLSQFMYAEPQSDDDKVNGNNLYKELVELPEYYHYREGELIRDNATQRLITASGGIKPTDVIDLGTGPVPSVLSKAVPTLEAVENLAGYTGVDNSLTYLLGATETVSRRFKGLHVGFVHSDFADLSTQFIKTQNPIFLLYGNVMSNFMSHDGVPNPEAMEFLQNIYNVISITGGRLIVGHDCNQDEASKEAGYNNPVAEKWMKNLPYRMERDLGVKFGEAGYNPDDFEYFYRWNAQAFCKEMGLRLKKDMTVTLGEESFPLKAGTELHMWNSNAYPPDVVSGMLKKIGFQPGRVMTDAHVVSKDNPLHNDGIARMALHVCRAPRDINYARLVLGGVGLA